MKINYPNGSTPFQISNTNDKGIKNKNIETNNYGNRGMSLEEDINTSNKQYLLNGKAVIHKKPTPIQVVSVDYPKRSAAKITEAYYRTASTTDYNGLYRGYYLDFEAKETKNKTLFPLKNFHQHQIDHMQQCITHGGIVFVIIRFNTLNETFVTPAQLIIDWWEQKENKRKSIPYQEIAENSFPVEIGFSPRLPYLDAIDIMIKNFNEEV